MTDICNHALCATRTGSIACLCTCRGIMPTGSGCQVHDPNAPEPPPFEDWVSLATAHLINSLDTAIDELQRDRDFLNEDDDVRSPGGRDRTIATELAIARFVQYVHEEQEG